MTHWNIAYSRDEAAETLEVESASKPTLDQAVTAVLKWAESNLEPLEPKDQPHEEQTPAVRLAERYAITITGITRD